MTPTSGPATATAGSGCSGGGRRRLRRAGPGDHRLTDLDWLVGGVDYTGDALPDLVVRRASGALLVLPARGDGTLGRALGPVGDAAGLTCSAAPAR